MTAQDIVIRPIITERSMSGIAMKKYTFEVAKDATKILPERWKNCSAYRCRRSTPCMCADAFAVREEARATRLPGKRPL